MVRSGKSVQVHHTVRDTSYAAWYVRKMVFKFIKSVSSTSYAAWYAQMKVFKFIAMLVMSYAAYYARMDLLQVYYDVSYASYAA